MSDQFETLDELANRRQYFRVIDHVSIEFTKIGEETLAAEQFELLPEFGLISEFQLLDVESKHLLRTITDKDKNLGQFLKIMNKKLDSLARVISLNHQIIPSESIVEVNLSEGGISLQCEQTIVGYLLKAEFYLSKKQMPDILYILNSLISLKLTNNLLPAILCAYKVSKNIKPLQINLRRAPITYANY